MRFPRWFRRKRELTILELDPEVWGEPKREFTERVFLRESRRPDGSTLVVIDCLERSMQLADGGLIPMRLVYRVPARRRQGEKG